MSLESLHTLFVEVFWKGYYYGIGSGLLIGFAIGLLVMALYCFFRERVR